MTDAIEIQPQESLPLDDEELWQAVATRDARFDGRFCYAVKTTGVYCRPSCPAKRPRRAHVSFHAGPEAAERAGYRACKRCNPAGPARAADGAAKIEEACRLIEKAESPIPLATLARAVGLSPHHFHRQFKSALGITPKAYGDALRNDRVRAALSGGASVTEALYEAGFGSSGRFYANAAGALGMAPRTFRDGGPSERIAYGVSGCSLGTVLVALSAKGVCAILLGDDAGDLTQAVRALFPQATLQEGDATFHATMSLVVSLVDRPDTPCDLPLDIRGTAFQRRVWEALRAIPAGRTVSYAELAAAIGAPSSVRAVAGACAANKLAVAIPCHRVVRGDGSLSGYRWGVDRKRALLDKERP